MLITTPNAKHHVCDFCGKHHRFVGHMFAGPNGAAICGECAHAIVAVIAGDKPGGVSARSTAPQGEVNHG